MRFKGQLLIPAQPGPGLAVDIEVADHQLAVVAHSGRLGVWPLDTVRVRRLHGDTFAMTVAGEDLHFVADDTISFAYDGIQAIERVRSGPLRRSGFRGLKGLLGLGEGARDGQPQTLTEAHSTTTGVILPPQPVTVDSSSELEPPRDDETYLSSPSGIELNANSEPGDSQTSHDAYCFEIPDWLNEPRDTEAHTQPSEPTARTGAESAGPASDVAVPSGPVDEDEEDQRCKAIRKDGLPCQSPIVGDSGYCFPHDPENPVGLMVRDAQEARTRLKQKRAHRLTRVYGRLDRALKQLEQGEIDTDQAMAMAQLARTMCAILEFDESDESGSEENTPLFT